jgi:lipoprotein
MKKLEILKMVLAVSTLSAFAGCSAIDTVESDAKRTPIGSVVTGETTDADSYMKRVSERNKAADRDTWRPQGDRF